jgi:hypothetical protein
MIPPLYFHFSEVEVKFPTGRLLILIFKVPTSDLKADDGLAGAPRPYLSAHKFDRPEPVLESVEVIRQEHIAQEWANGTKHSRERRCIFFSVHLIVGLPPYGINAMR